VTLPASNFVITDGGQTFRVLEDEDGDVWWGYGHWNASEFIDEVNRWLHHVCYSGASHPDDLFPGSANVAHLWAKYQDEEHFRLVDKPDDKAFPVTRLRACDGPI
jgi:hypothetical protein